MENFTCIICFSMYDEHIRIPKVMGSCCGQTICDRCLKGCTKGFYITCPMCKKISEYSKLPKNVALLSLLPTKDQIDFSPCKKHKRIQDLFCETCKEKLCALCLHEHSKMSCEVVSLETFMENCKQITKDWDHQILLGSLKVIELEATIQEGEKMTLHHIEELFQARLKKLHECREKLIKDCRNFYNQLNRYFMVQEENSDQNLLNVRDWISESGKLIEKAKGEEDYIEFYYYSRLESSKTALKKLKQWIEKEDSATCKSEIDKTEIYWPIDFQVKLITNEKREIPEIVKDFKAITKNLNFPEFLLANKNDENLSKAYFTDLSKCNLDQTRAILWNFEHLFDSKVPQKLKLKEDQINLLVPRARDIQMLNLDIKSSIDPSNELQRSWASIFKLCHNLTTLTLNIDTKSMKEFYTLFKESANHMRKMYSLKLNFGQSCSLREIVELLNYIPILNLTCFKFEYHLHDKAILEKVKKILSSMKPIKEISIAELPSNRQTDISQLKEYVFKPLLTSTQCLTLNLMLEFHLTFDLLKNITNFVKKNPLLNYFRFFFNLPVHQLEDSSGFLELWGAIRDSKRLIFFDVKSNRNLMMKTTINYELPTLVSYLSLLDLKVIKLELANNEYRGHLISAETRELLNSKEILFENLISFSLTDDSNTSEETVNFLFEFLQKVKNPIKKLVLNFPNITQDPESIISKVKDNLITKIMRLEVNNKVYNNIGHLIKN